MENGGHSDRGRRDMAVPLQTLLEQRQMLFQPPDLLPLDPGDLPVSVHVPGGGGGEAPVTESLVYCTPDSVAVSTTCPCRA